MIEERNFDHGTSGKDRLCKFSSSVEQRAYSIRGAFSRILYNNDQDR